MKPERVVQPRFSIAFRFNGLALAIPIAALTLWLDARPSRRPAPAAIVTGRADAVRLPSGDARAWRLAADDPRFGGLSALAFDEGKLLALTDSGVVVRFAPPRPGSQALQFALRDLPAGPGSPQRKSARDSESLLRDPRGRGWWVGFETVHSLWLFDRHFDRALERRRLDVDWPANKGSEALVALGDAVAALPEMGGRAAGARLDAPLWTADATRLPDGRLVVLTRAITIRGFDNQLRIAAGAGKPARRIMLKVGMLDNLEGMAAAPLPGGGTRLWIVGDNNFRPWMRTLLVALDLPAGA